MRWMYRQSIHLIRCYQLETPFSNLFLQSIFTIQERLFLGSAHEYTTETNLRVGVDSAASYFHSTQFHKQELRQRRQG
jgi:hypothetical protein